MYREALNRRPEGLHVSNGPNWVDQLGGTYNATDTRVFDLAVGSARRVTLWAVQRSVVDQVGQWTQFLDPRRINGLDWIGINDDDASFAWTNVTLQTDFHKTLMNRLFGQLNISMQMTDETLFSSPSLLSTALRQERTTVRTSWPNSRVLSLTTTRSLLPAYKRTRLPIPMSPWLSLTPSPCSTPFWITPIPLGSSTGSVLRISITRLRRIRTSRHVHQYLATSGITTYIQAGPFMTFSRKQLLTS